MRSFLPKIFLTIAIPVLITVGTAQTNGPVRALEQAQNCYLQQQLSAAARKTDSLLSRFPQNPGAHILQGLLLLDSRQPEDHRRAGEILRKYSHKLDKDPFASYALGLYYKVTENRGEARKYFLRAVDRQPDFVPALMEAADTYYRDMLDYLNKYTETEVPFSFRDYAIEDYDYAVSYLKQALDYDPGNRRAAYLLGNLYYEVEDYTAMETLFTRMLKSDSTDKDMNLFLGLAYLGKRRYQDAAGCFDAALARMSGEEREVFTDPEYLIQDKNLLASADTGRTEYWKGRDPMFLTHENERLLAHYARVAYANMRFSIPKLDVPGWQTDRGKTYIRYGKPSYVVAYGKNMEAGAVYSPMEIWVYPRFRLSFTDEFWNGNYRFSEPTPNSKTAFKERTNIDFGIVAHNVFSEIPETFEMELPGGVFNSAYRMTFFKGESGVDAAVSFTLPVEEQLYEPRQDYLAGLFILDGKKKPVFNVQQPYELNFAGENPQRGDSTLTRTLTFNFVPGDFDYSFELLNKTLDKNFVNRDNMTLPDFGGDSLTVSDLLLSRRVVFTPGEDAFARNGLYMKPSVLQQFSGQDTLYIYFEVYHLRRNGAGDCHYTVDNSIITKEDGGFISRLLGSDRQKISVVNEYSTANTRDFVLQSMDIANLLPGEYTLEIDVRDNVSGIHRKKETKITIINSLTDY